MVKFNYDACKQMDSILNSESKLKKGMIMVNNNLIDSNMFIRAMVLACDHFLQAGGEMAEFASNSRLMKHFREFEKHVQFVVQLVSILNVTEKLPLNLGEVLSLDKQISGVLCSKIHCCSEQVYR